VHDIETPHRTTAGLAGVSAVSWSAIFAGTAAAAGTSLLLFALAAGLDLASIAAAPRRAVSAASVTAVATVALIATQWISAGLGGYITGRLRTSWVGTHTHEVFFRDTAHGFITWCVATIVLASGVISPASSFLGAVLRAGPAPASHAAAANVSWGSSRDAYPRGATRWAEFGGLAAAVAGPRAQDGLVVPAAPRAAGGADSAPGQFAPLAAAPRIIANCCTQQRFTVAVADDAADVKDAKDAATGSILTALSMLLGAFVASVAAAIGGRLRDARP
jgi:hypothetical protein